MSTSGALCFVVDGSEKVVYNNSDSYPEGLGQDVLAWLRVALKDEPTAAEAVRALRPVDESQPPTAADYARIAGTDEPTVRTGDDWYWLLRHTQRDPAALLTAGLYEDAEQFPLHSGYCEWAYVVDFDARTFEVYKGFRKQRPTEGRWVGRESRHDTSPFFPVQRLAAFPFDELPESIEL